MNPKTDIFDFLRVHTMMSYVLDILVVPFEFINCHPILLTA